MITRIKAKNYRCFRDLDFRPNDGLNIIVGDNEAGKSTLLEVVSLVISGRIRARWATDDINPYWFNQGAVEEFFRDLNSGKMPSPPDIKIEIFFSQETPGTEKLCGLQNSASEDCPGLVMQVHPDPEHAAELQAYLAEPDLPQLIPTDLYSVTWRDFSGEPVARQPRGLGFALVNGGTATAYSGVDYKLRQLIRDFVSPQEGAQIALEHRKAKAEISRSKLADVNQRLKMDSESFGISLQMDQSAAANWGATVTPYMEGVPFSMLGQGRQVATKIALAMSRSAESTKFVLVEEPENHLSHTQMQSVIEEISRLSGGRQLFITTHSSFVLNRLGLEALHLMHDATVTQFNTRQISQDTLKYFQKQSGYDTLRLAIASKVVVVEGPSDEMIFNLAYKQIKGVEPRANGIDVITLGTRGKRALELGAALGRKMAVLRDNDGKDPSHWEDAAAHLLESGKRVMFIGQVADGRTLEPQVARIGSNEDRLRELLALDEGDGVEEAMTAGKTDWAWQVSQAEPELTWPQYFRDAIEFIDAS